MFGKSIEYWAAVIGMVLYVALRDAESEALWRRLVKTLLSAFLTYALSPELAVFLGSSEVVAAIAIMAFGLIILDTLTALASDRAFIKELIRARLGGRKNE